MYQVVSLDSGDSFLQHQPSINRIILPLLVDFVAFSFFKLNRLLSNSVQPFNLTCLIQDNNIPISRDMSNHVVVWVA